MLLCQLTLFFLLAPRGEEIKEQPIRLELSATFLLENGRSLEHGTYEIEWSNGELVFTSTSTLQIVLRQKAQAKPCAEGPRLAAVSVDSKTDAATLQVRLGKEEIVLRGKEISVASDAVPDAPSVKIEDRAQATSQPTDPVQRMWEVRMRQQVAHCVQRAAHWPIGKYEKCVCPVVSKLKMPPIAGAHALQLDATRQVSIELDKKGAVKSCSLK